MIADDDLKSFVQEHVRLMAVDARGLADARERAGKFLIAASILVTDLKDTEEAVGRLDAEKDMVEAQIIADMSGTKITEKKTDAKRNPQFVAVRTAHTDMEARENYLKNYIKIFENAHIMYRQFSNG